MKADCHIHAVLDGIEWKNAIRRHAQAPDEGFLHRMLRQYQALGYTYLRDGGDRWGVGAAAREMAAELGIVYKTPLAPLCKVGCYGAFIGKSYVNLKEYAQLVREQKAQGADFVKIMISGLMDFDRFGVLTQPGYPAEEIRELVHIAHEEGFCVMAHANGARTVEAAAEAGVDSVEHGAYLDGDALAAMAEMGTVWVPTLSTVGNLRGKGRFREEAVMQILEQALENVGQFARMGGFLAPGTDAGAWEVPHGSLTEFALLEQAIGQDTVKVLEKGAQRIQDRF